MIILWWGKFLKSIFLFRLDRVLYHWGFTFKIRFLSWECRLRSMIIHSFYKYLPNISYIPHIGESSENAMISKLSKGCKKAIHLSCLRKSSPRKEERAKSFVRLWILLTGIQWAWSRVTLERSSCSQII